jgi:hypothetical protein
MDAIDDSAILQYDSGKDENGDMFINDKNTIKQLYVSKRVIKNQMEDKLITCSNYESKYNCVNPRLKLHIRVHQEMKVVACVIKSK